MAICAAQGGMRDIPRARHSHDIVAKQTGEVTHIDNRAIARVAKLAGAPRSKAAGIYLHTPLKTLVERGQPLFTIYTESQGQLHYALNFLNQIPDIIHIRSLCNLSS